MAGIVTKAELRAKPFRPPLPHVVILGAGASKAAMPKGDKSGQIIPLMDDLPKILGNDWNELVKIAQPGQGNFEADYSWIKKNGNFGPQLSKIEKLIEEYFQTLGLPERPTIYDYLVLGLRGKDVIATFNWDPFLMQAYIRNRHIAELPDIRFLHGCVDFATCIDHDILGVPFQSCPKCHRPLSKGRLFYPDEEKDYAKDTIIYRDWLTVTGRLKEAFHLSIFGYSGPATDYNARKLLLEGWGQTPIRDFCDVEIIDIKKEDVLRRCWEGFFPHYHHMIFGDFWECSIARWPRRTAEWKLSASLDGMFVDDIGPLRTESMSELQEWFACLAEAEDAIAKTETDM